MMDFKIVEEITVKELMKLLDTGKLTSKELVELYIKRISEIDKAGPNLNSVLEINPDALSVAQVRDAQRVKGEIMGPLHGVPVLIKDNIESGDKMHTTAGATALKDNYAKEDAFIVKKLKSAGAIILGKTNLSEWANFIAIGMRHGYSSHGGQVLSPYKPDVYEVGGSSTGSAVATSANLVMCSVGTETSGSIIMPASLASCVGIKPSMGLVSRTGIIPLAHSQDVAGPICRTVEDAALMLSVMIGEDDADAITYFARDFENEDFSKYLNKDGLKGKKLGFLREVYYDKLCTEGKKIMEKTLEALKACGAEIIDPVEEFLAAHITPTLISSPAGLDINVLYHEFKVDVNNYLAKLDPTLPVHTLSELIAFNNANKEKPLKYGQAHLEKADETDGSLTDAAYINSRLKDENACAVESIDKVMDKYNLDAIIYPHYFAQTVGARVGYPSVTVPAGYSEESGPISITFVAKKFEDTKIIEMAYAYEQATKVRKAPVFN